VNDALYAEFYGPTTRRAWYGFGASANPNFTFVNEMTNGDITFLPARNTIFRQGNVGIGTTTPGAKLDVEDSATPGGVLRLGNTDTTISTGEIAGKIEFYNADATYGAGVHAYIQSRALDSGANYALDFYTDDVNGPDHIMTMSGGNVGINETSPDYKLDVNGSFGFTPGSSVTPADNGDVIIEATNNTTLTFKLKGSDGTVRSGTVNLS